MVYAQAVMAFVLMVVPMAIIDLVASPFRTWRSVMLQARREAVIGEVRNLVASLENDLIKRKADRKEIN